MSASQKFMNTLKLNFLFTLLRDTPMTTLYLEKCVKKTPIISLLVMYLVTMDLLHTRY